jgi:hypothetical protein
MEVEVNASRDSEDESDPEEPPTLGNLQPPLIVKAVPRLLVDIELLRLLTAAEDPPHCTGCQPRVKSTFFIVMGMLLEVFWLVH